MNGKFFTMFTTTLLTVGALFSNVNAAGQDPISLGDKVSAFADGTTYHLVQQVAATAADGDVVMGMSASGATLKGLGALVSNGGTKFTPGTGEDINNYIWTLESKTQNGAAFYQLKNVKTGKLLAVTKDATALVTSAANANNESNISYFAKFGVGGVISPQGFATTTPTTPTVKYISVDATGITIADAPESKFYAYRTAPIEVPVSDLKDDLTGLFTLSATGVETANNPFQAIKAVTVEKNFLAQINAGEFRRILAGTYFVVDYPKDMPETMEATATSAEQKAFEEMFRKSTFVVLSPNVVVKTDAAAQGKGDNFAVTTIEGKDFNFYAPQTGETSDAEKLSNGSQTSIQNAIFNIYKNEEFKDFYSLEVAEFRCKLDATKPGHTAKKVTIEVVDVNSVKYLATIAGVKRYTFKNVDIDAVDPLTLLSKDGKSVYNIRFVSGETAETENGKYLTVGKTDASATSYSFLAHGSAASVLDNPQYQFVISDVKEGGKIIEFTNRETGEKFECKLRTTENPNEYYVAYAKTAGGDTEFTIGNATKDGSIDYTLTNGTSNEEDLLKTTIELIKVDAVDKYAGFANRDAEAGYTFLSFAKNGSVSAEKAFAKIKRTFDVGTKSYSYYIDNISDKESDAALFELVKSETEKIAVINYAYKRDAEKYDIKTKGDTIAYYTYAIKMIDPREVTDYYVGVETRSGFMSLKMENQTKAKDATQFVIKENKDGSVSFVMAGTENVYGSKYLVADAKSIVVTSIEGESNSMDVDGAPYLVAGANEVKSYLLAENLGASLEAKLQDVAFQAENGGYISLSDLNEGKVAISTEVTDALSFRLDTADSKSTLPSFYIIKDGDVRMFMYFAQDSADYYKKDPSTGDNFYTMNAAAETKVIFKAADLVDQNTLTTTVNGKPVVVAAIPGDNVLGGLNNFKFNIFRADDGSDNYLLRCKENNKYVANYNGILYLADSKAKALKVDVQKGNAPVSNEGAPEVSTISVIAGNGQITINGAEGKNVVVSNVLGQIVANKVITSSNETMTVPSGVVFVAVKGETTVKAVVR